MFTGKQILNNANIFIMTESQLNYIPKRNDFNLNDNKVVSHISSREQFRENNEAIIIICGTVSHQVVMSEWLISPPGVNTIAESISSQIKLSNYQMFTEEYWYCVLSTFFPHEENLNFNLIACKRANALKLQLTSCIQTCSYSNVKIQSMSLFFYILKVLSIPYSHIDGTTLFGLVNTILNVNCLPSTGTIYKITFQHIIFQNPLWGHCEPNWGPHTLSWEVGLRRRGNLLPLEVNGTNL